MSIRHESRHFHFVPIANGVVAAIARDGGAAFANSGIIDLGDKTLIYDTSVTPTAAKDLIQMAHTLTGRQHVDYVINSHYHRDHIRGNSAFPRNSVIVASRRTRELMLTEAKIHVKQDAESIASAMRQTDRELIEVISRADSVLYHDLKFDAGWQRGVYETISTLKLRMPDITFDRRIGINGKNGRAVLIAIEDAHTESDSVLYLPHADIAFVGDLLLVERHAWIGELKRSAYEDAVTFLQSFGLKQLVPGHGKPCFPNVLSQQLDYVQQMEDMVQAAVEQGASLEDVLRLPCPLPFAEWRLRRLLYRKNLETLYRRYAGDAKLPSESNTPSADVDQV